MRTYSDFVVIKDGSMLVTRAMSSDGPVICKIAKSDNGRLEREASQIRRIQKHYPLHAERMPELIHGGVFDSGPFNGKAYYTLEFLDGEILSHYLQNTNDQPDKISAVISNIVATLLDMINEQECDSAFNYSGGSWLKQHIQSAYEILLQIEVFNNIADSKKIRINEAPRRPMLDCLNALSETGIYDELDTESSFLSPLGHWNFHSDNIILFPPGSEMPFMVIDPDSKIDFADPLFGIARLYYSFPHEVAETDHFTIKHHSSATPSGSLNSFSVEYLWSESVMENYTFLFKNLLANPSYNPALMDSRLQDHRLQIRLDINLLYCLLRGATINYQPEPEANDFNAETLPNRGVFLYLVAVDFANMLVDKWSK